MKSPGPAEVIYIELILVKQLQHITLRYLRIADAKTGVKQWQKGMHNLNSIISKQQNYPGDSFKVIIPLSNLIMRSQPSIVLSL